MTALTVTFATRGQAAIALDAINDLLDGVTLSAHSEAEAREAQATLQDALNRDPVDPPRCTGTDEFGLQCKGVYGHRPAEHWS